MVTWYQLCNSNINNLQTDLFKPYMESRDVPPHRDRVDIELMIVKRCSTIFRFLKVETYY